MTSRVLAPFVAVLALAALVGTSPSVPAASDDNADIAVQARGPVHEGFAQPFDSAPRPGAIIPKAPPDPVPEIPPDQKPEGDNVQWLPGYWNWDGDRNDWTWVSGFWRAVPPDRKWVGGYWRRVESGWQWVSGYWAPANQERPQLLDEPPAPLEAGPSVPAPNDDSIYVPGIWMWRGERFAWRPGYWCPARFDWVWSPAHYVWTPAGYVFVDGCWDYPLDTRGVLFAPVCFERPLWTRPGWCFRPSFVVNIDTPFFSALFVRPSCNSYYFGDYYDPNYLAAGYYPWCRYGARHFDPLFGYYGWTHRHDPRWLRGLGATYAARRGGTLSRPPHTLVEQAALLRRTPAAAAALTVVRPLGDFHGGRKLAPLSGAQVSRYQAAASHVRDSARQRPLLEKPGDHGRPAVSSPARRPPAVTRPIIVNHTPDRPHGQHSAAAAPAVVTRPAVRPYSPAPPRPAASQAITRPERHAPAIVNKPAAPPPPRPTHVSPPPPPRPTHSSPPPSRPPARPVHVSPPPQPRHSPPPPPHGGGQGGHHDGGRKK